ncbi:hypothetical protein OAL43_02560 [bacterium]|nr:hypothetical protein [bacterium]
MGQLVGQGNDGTPNITSSIRIASTTAIHGWPFQGLVGKQSHPSQQLALTGKTILLTQ